MSTEALRNAARLHVICDRIRNDKLLDERHIRWLQAAAESIKELAWDAAWENAYGEERREAEGVR